MFPIRDTIKSRTTPYVVYFIIGVNLLVFLYQLSIGAGGFEETSSAVLLFNNYGLVPARFSDPGLREHFGLIQQVIPFFSSVFLHGGIFHFAGNMWMLWIFGDNVEDWLGHSRFLFFYLVCGVFAGLVHLVFNWSSAIPTIGASGAIAGVMGAYMFLYPKARVLTLVPIFIFIQFFEIPAVVFLGIWFVLQLISGTSGAAGSVAWWAHIGGFVAGIVMVLMMGAKPQFGGGPRKPRFADKVRSSWR